MPVSPPAPPTPPAPDPIARLVATPAALTMFPDDERPLATTAYAASGAVLVGQPLTYASSDQGVALVGPTGMVAAIAAGAATIRISSTERPGVAIDVPVVVQNRQYPLTLTFDGPGRGTLTVSPPGTTCSATCTVQVPAKTILTLDAHADGNNRFASYSLSCMTTATRCEFAVTGPQTITAQFDTVIPRYPLAVTLAGAGRGSVRSTPAGVDCPDVCEPTFLSGTHLTLTAVPAAGSLFTGWAGDCTGIAVACPVVVSRARAVSATFTPVSVTSTLTVVVNGSGAVASTPTGLLCPGVCQAAFPATTTVTLTATSVGGRLFTGWSGACAGTAPTCVVAMSEARTVVATFSPTVTTAPLSVALTGDGTGTVVSTPVGIVCSAGACSASYPVGANVGLAATPVLGSIFGGWGGACSGLDVSCTVSMAAARSVTATFTRSSPLLTVVVTGAGTGTVRSTPAAIVCPTTCGAPFPAGSTVTLTAVANAGSTFAGWSGACAGAAATCVVSIVAGRTVTATFTPVVVPTYTVTVTTIGPGYGIIRSAGGGLLCSTGCTTDRIPIGTPIEIEAIAADQFGGWGGACSGVTPICRIPGTGNANVTATFLLPPPASALIYTTSSSVAIGASLQATVYAWRANGERLFYTTAEWRTGDVSVLRIENTTSTVATLVGVRPGTVTISATIGGVTVTQLITVVLAP